MVSRVSSPGLSPRRARGPICAWSSRVSAPISSRPTRAPGTDGSSSSRPWRRSWRGWTDACRHNSPDPLRRIIIRRSHEYEQMGSASPPLAVHCLYGDRHRQFRRPGTGRTSPLAGLLAAGPALLAPVQRSLHVRAALCRQPAQWATGRRTGVNAMSSGESRKEMSPSDMIDARIRELDDWRGKTLSRVRTLIKQADPEAVEEWKWRGVPVWSHDGIICTGETYKSVVKLTFAKGASLGDPKGLFNSSLEGNTRRAIDFHEGDKIDEKALKALIRAAAALNISARAKKSKSA